jgi:transcriptional regulator with XRE-family HTH domain
MLEYDRKKLGQYLKSSREQRNLTQAHVSGRLGYTSPQFISNIERGISVVPLDTLARMLNLYKANPMKAAGILLESQEKLLTAKFKIFKKSSKKN